MAASFFDNRERQDRVKDLLGSLNEIRQEITDSVKTITKQAAELQKALEFLQGQGKVASMQDLEAKAKTHMSEEAYGEYQDLLDSVKKMDHDLWVVGQVMLWVDAGYAGLTIAAAVTSRIGTLMLARAVNQAVDAAQVGNLASQAARNLAARGAQAMRPRSGAFHLAQDAPELVRVRRLQNMGNVLKKLTRIGGIVLLAANLVFVLVEVVVQDSQRTELMGAIKDLYGARHIIKQLALALESEVFHITDAQILLNNRAMKESTLADTVARGYITVQQKDQMIKEYEEQQKAEHDARSPKGGILLPSDEDVCKELKKRDDHHASWQKNDPDLPRLLEWLKEEAKAT